MSTPEGPRALPDIDGVDGVQDSVVESPCREGDVQGPGETLGRPLGL